MLLPTRDFLFNKPISLDQIALCTFWKDAEIPAIDLAGYNRKALFKHSQVEMIVRRLPHGRVSTMTRRSESDEFGLEVNSANEVTSVSPSAQALGLSSIANPADPSADVGTTVTWTLTEVNNRPLSLYESSARERMNALGRDVSVVLQPSDLVGAIRKKLRAVRGYKSFVMQ